MGLVLIVQNIAKKVLKTYSSFVCPSSERLQVLRPSTGIRADSITHEEIEAEAQFTISSFQGLLFPVTHRTPPPPPPTYTSTLPLTVCRSLSPYPT